MSEGKRVSLIKPTLKTPFHIDFDWWKENENDWHVFLRSMLCPQHQEAFANMDEAQLIDWVDPITAEVKPLEGIQHALISHCVKQPDFLTQQTALVDAVFRLFLTNGNSPMSSEDLGARLHRLPETILRTLAGPRIYKGLRPYHPAASLN